MKFVGYKRMNPRTGIIARVEALWVDWTGNPRVAPALLEDTSASGACVRLKEPLRVGSKVTIKWRREEFTGTVKHSKKVATDYLVGIERDGEKQGGCSA
jgi:hypothetical protein